MTPSKRCRMAIPLPCWMSKRLFPPGTQGDTSGLPVDIIGDMIVVMDTNWQVKWYWDSFDPSHGGNGYARLPITRTAVLGETCGTNTAGCPPVFLLSPNVAPLAHDWLHANTLYYWPHSGQGGNTPGDIIWSSRHQDWVFKIDYEDRKAPAILCGVWGRAATSSFRMLTTIPGHGSRTSMTPALRTTAPDP